MAFTIEKVAEISIDTQRFYRVWGILPLEEIGKYLTVLRTSPDQEGDTYAVIDLAAASITEVEQDGDTGFNTYTIARLLDGEIRINQFGQCCATGYEWAGHIIVRDTGISRGYRRLIDTYAGSEGNPNNVNNYSKPLVCAKDGYFVFAGDQGGMYNKNVPISVIRSAADGSDIKGQVVHWKVFDFSDIFGVHQHLYSIGDYIYGIAGRHVHGEGLRDGITVWRASIDDVLSMNDGGVIRSAGSFEEIKYFGDGTTMNGVYTAQALVGNLAAIRGDVDGTGTKIYIIDVTTGAVRYTFGAATVNNYDPSPVGVAYGRFLVITDNGSVALVNPDGTKPLDVPGYFNLEDYLSPPDQYNRRFLAIAVVGEAIHAINFARGTYEVHVVKWNDKVPVIEYSNGIVKVRDTVSGDYVSAVVKVSANRCVGSGDVLPDATTITVPPDGYDIRDIIIGRTASIVVVGDDYG